MLSLFLATSHHARAATLVDVILFTNAQSVGVNNTGEASATAPLQEGSARLGASGTINTSTNAGNTIFSLQVFTSRLVTRGRGRATARVTFTVTEPTQVSIRPLRPRGRVVTLLNGEEAPLSSILDTGTHVIQISASNSEGEAQLRTIVTIKATPPVPDEFRWKEYTDGQWEDGNRWKAGDPPTSDDVAIFDLVPPAGQRTLPLPFINLRSTGSQSAGGLDISSSAVRVQGFDLSLGGTSSEFDSLTIRNGGELFVDSALGGSRVNFATTNTTVGEGQKISLGGKNVLDECTLTIAEGVVWQNSGTLSIGEKMKGAVQIETRVIDRTPSRSTDDLFLGLRPGSSGSLDVLGDFVSGGFFSAARPKTSSAFGVSRGGKFTSQFAECGSAVGTTSVGFINDRPESEAGGPRDYTSEGERSTWEITGLLSLSGFVGGPAGKAGGGVTLLQVNDGGLLRAAAVVAGAGSPTVKSTKDRIAGLIASGFDPVDNEQSEIRIAGSLLVGEGCSANVFASEGGLISAQSITIKALGRLASSGQTSPGDAEQEPLPSLITTTLAAPVGSSLGPLTVEGGGIVELEKAGDLRAGLLQLGGVSPGKRLAILRIDSSDTLFPRSRLQLAKLVVGAGVSFPARLDLVDGRIEISEDSQIAEGGRLSGFGFIDSPANIVLQNNGEIVVSPGAARALAIAGGFAQSSGARLVLTVDKANNAANAPLVIEGESLILGGEVTLRFSGGRKPARGESFALIKAENALITNQATFKVAGAPGAFDIVQDNSGLKLVFK